MSQAGEAKQRGLHTSLEKLHVTSIDHFAYVFVRLCYASKAAVNSSGNSPYIITMNAIKPHDTTARATMEHRA